MTAGALAERFEVSRPAVSRHLRVLRESGLVDVEENGRERIYRLRPGPLAELDGWLRRLLTDLPQRLDALETEVAGTGRDRRRAARKTGPDIEAATANHTKETA